MATHTEINEEQGVREAMLSAPGDGRARAIQLLAPLRPGLADRQVPRPQRARASSRWPTAWPTSTRPARALRDQGMRLLYDEPRRGTAGSRINFVHPKDAGGVLVELVEPAADRPLTDSRTDPAR